VAVILQGNKMEEVHYLLGRPEEVGYEGTKIYANFGQM